MNPRDRLGKWAANDREHRARCPYDCVLRLKGSKADYHWGRFSSPERAHQAGHDAMRATRTSDLPFGKQCAGYRVIDSRTGATVADPGLIERLASAA